MLKDVAEGKTWQEGGLGGRLGAGAPFRTAGEDGVGAEQGPPLDLTLRAHRV